MGSDQWRSQPRQFSPAMQILNYYHYSYLQKLIVCTVNEHKNFASLMMHDETRALQSLLTIKDN